MYSSFSGSRGNLLSARTYPGAQQNDKQKIRMLLCVSFWNLQMGLGGKFIIGINLWNPRDSTDSAQSEMSGILSGSSL